MDAPRQTGDGPYRTALGVRNGYRLNEKEKLWTTVRVRCGQKKEEPECA